MNNFFESNLASLAVKNPNLAFKLQNITPNQKYEVFIGEDIANYNIVDKNENVAIFSTQPLQETMKRFDTLKESLYHPYLYCYGMGNGVLHKLLLDQEIRKRIVVIEPELEILFIALHFIDFSQEILSGKLVLREDLDDQGIASLFEEDKHSKFYVKTYMLEIFNPYYERYREKFLRINQSFIRAIEHLVVAVGNDAKDAIIGIKHHIANLPQTIQTPTLVDLVLNLKNRDTAIIVSTGPSLHKQLPLLKQIAPYATLFCIDASFPILYQNGIKPDIVLSLERVEATAKFYEETPKEAFEGVIFAITSIVHPRLRRAIEENGGLIQYSYRPFGYTTYFGIHEYGYLGIGMSAANMAYELIVHARFKRCVIIGQDLAFGDDGSSHSKGAVYGSDEIQKGSKRAGQSVYLTRYGGEGEVESTQVWKMFLNFYERDIANTPYPLEVINSTEGGARIKGTLELPFSEVLQRIPREEKQPIALDFPTEEVRQNNLKIIEEKCRLWLKEGKKKQKRIEKVFLKVAHFCEELETLNEEKRLEMIDYQKLDSLSKEIEKIKLFFKEPLFGSLFVDALQSYIFHQELDIARVLVKTTDDEMQRRAKQIELIFLHKYWLFSLAGGIANVLEAVKLAQKEWKL
ncbi:motility associated factor glycosyltransferase family protein [Helicobacter kayseriensis]|uniref:motility associated factor glycosyltransferase family protein n=1 Tax=Helicobacter kayseriensis TaxID=2905877 RepID=UPI001E3F0077|nr:motility associated factor glycosyltransferase family protein [Helicobacter kayseriensis]MCE3046577.1 motility associated factor glycosyltransferase family protein [Helicobacter kayseriensis]MCE3048121.1 motility associated factor glycosyltransferase family protein [Helicobacter kayseriensis]